MNVEWLTLWKGRRSYRYGALGKRTVGILFGISTFQILTNLNCRQLTSELQMYLLVSSWILASPIKLILNLLRRRGTRLDPEESRLLTWTGCEVPKLNQPVCGLVRVISIANGHQKAREVR